MNFVIPGLFLYSYTVYRQTGGSYISGRWVNGGETSFVLYGSIQPTKGSETDKLPSGVLEKGVVKLYTDIDLQISVDETNIKADQVDYEGDRYEVYSKLVHKGIEHFKYLLVKI